MPPGAGAEPAQEAAPLGGKRGGERCQSWNPSEMLLGFRLHGSSPQPTAFVEPGVSGDNFEQRRGIKRRRRTDCDKEEAMDEKQVKGGGEGGGGGGASRGKGEWKVEGVEGEEEEGEGGGEGQMKGEEEQEQEQERRRESRRTKGGLERSSRRRQQGRQLLDVRTFCCSCCWVPAPASPTTGWELVVATAATSPSAPWFL